MYLSSASSMRLEVVCTNVMTFNGLKKAYEKMFSDGLRNVLRYYGIGGRL